MATAKRLYLYGVSAAGLMMGVVGATLLFRTLVNNLHIGVQYKTGQVSSSLDHDMLSLGLGLIVAGAIVWLFHWAIVERMVHGPDEAAAAERRSIVRSVYFAAVLGTSLPIAAIEWIALVARIIADRLEAPGTLSSMVLAGIEDDATLLSVAVAATLVFVYHAWVRDRDLRQTDLIAGAAAWVSRFYLYGAVFVGLVSALGEISAIVRTLAQQAASVATIDGIDIGSLSGLGVSVNSLGQLAHVPEGADWVRPVTTSIVGIVVWGAIWLGHWMYSLRLRRAQTPQGEAERISKVRVTFFAAVVYWGVLTVVNGASDGLGQLFAALTDVKNQAPTWYLVFVPPVLAIPAGVAWWWHRMVAIEEEPAGPAGVSAARLLLYVTALVGIATLAGGGVQAIQAVVVQVFSPLGASNPELWKLPVSLGIAALVVGGFIWVWAWFLAEARLRLDRTDATTYSRSYYMYVVLGASVVAGATALAFFVYRYFHQVIGPNDPALASNVAWILATLVVAGAILVYHSWIYRRDAGTPEGQPLAMPLSNPPVLAAPAPRARSRAAAAPPPPAAPAPAAAPALPAPPAAPAEAPKRTRTRKPQQ
jgi:hypothetical protein